jgi:hypothetical protein
MGVGVEVYLLLQLLLFLSTLKQNTATKPQMPGDGSFFMRCLLTIT